MVAQMAERVQSPPVSNETRFKYTPLCLCIFMIDDHGSWVISPWKNPHGGVLPQGA